MKTLLFVDHAFHRRTKSSQFFMDLLADDYRIEQVFVHPEDGELINPADYDHVHAVVLWQIDYMAPIFLSAGLPVLVVPMFDSAANMPDTHWRMMRGAKFVSFSLNVHAKITAAGGDSLLVKYFPPVPDRAVTDFSSLRGFFWERAPDQISMRQVTRLVGTQLEHLHVHQALDDRRASSSVIPDDFETPTTITRWLPNHDDLLTILDDANVYIAPRRAEGIGMAFLEAMARGCCVLAHDLPTHNEYIANGVNGVLFNANLEQTVLLNDAERLGRWARQTAEAGRQVWMGEHVPMIMELVASLSREDVKAADAIRYEPEVLAGIPDSYSAGFQRYVEFLRLSIAPYIDGCDGAGSTPVAAHQLANPKQFGRHDVGISFLAAGFGVQDQHHAWMTDTTGSISLPTIYEEPRLVVIRGHLPEHRQADCRLSLAINGQLVFTRDISPDDGDGVEIYGVLPLGVGAYAQLQIVVSRLFGGGSKAASQPLGFGLQEIELFDVSDITWAVTRRLIDDLATWLPAEFDRLNFLDWCFNTGSSPYSIASQVAFDNQPLEQIVKHQIDRQGPWRTEPSIKDAIWRSRQYLSEEFAGQLPVHALHRAIAASRSDVYAKYPFEAEGGQLAPYLAWYYLHAIREYDLSTVLSDAELTDLLGVCPATKGKDPINRLTYLVWMFRSDLQSSFDINTPEGRKALNSWIFSHGIQEYEGLGELFRRARDVTVKQSKILVKKRARAQ